jgi:hypothetical protein
MFVATSEKLSDNIIHLPKSSIGVKPKQGITVQKVENFLSNLQVRVFDKTSELTVLSVYLDDDGVVCVDVEHGKHPLQH